MDAIHMVQFLIWVMEKEEMKGGLLFLDQEKAFDKVDHGFLWQVLKAFGFPEEFIKVIMLFYNGASSMVKVNGFLSEAIPIRSGVRQGDSLSPILFILVIEILAIMLRNNKDFKGIGKAAWVIWIKILLYADDVAIPFSSVEDLNQIKETIVLYCKASGAKVNHKKSQGGLNWFESACRLGSGMVRRG